MTPTTPSTAGQSIRRRAKGLDTTHNLRSYTRSCVHLDSCVLRDAFRLRRDLGEENWEFLSKDFVYAGQFRHRLDT